MKTYKMKVWHDYQVCDTYEVEVQANSEEEAMQLAEEAVNNGEGTLWREGSPFNNTYEVNDGSIETIED